MNMTNTSSTAKKGTESVNNNDIETKDATTSAKSSGEAETGNTEISEGKHEDKMDVDNDSLEKSAHVQDVKKEDEDYDENKVKVEEKEMQATCDNDDKTSNAEGDQPNKSLDQAITKAPTPTHPYDEIMSMLKTGYPLLALSMETMVDQIQLKFKPQPDEEMYRLVVALYNEGVQVLFLHH
jgi:transformation/transcription domain-associated protein